MHCEKISVAFWCLTSMCVEVKSIHHTIYQKTRKLSSSRENFPHAGNIWHLGIFISLKRFALSHTPGMLVALSVSTGESVRTTRESCLSKSVQMAAQKSRSCFLSKGPCSTKLKFATTKKIYSSYKSSIPTLRLLW